MGNRAGPEMSLREAGILLVLGAIVGTGAYQDIRFRHLPHWLCALALVAGLGLGVMQGGIGWFWMSLLHATIALLAGMGLFAIGAVGGGDAKYYAALAAWFPLRQGLQFFVMVTLAGLVLLVAYYLLRPRRPRGGIPRQKDDPFEKLPYGVAISLGALLAQASVQTGT